MVCRCHPDCWVQKEVKKYNNKLITYYSVYYVDVNVEVRIGESYSA